MLRPQTAAIKLFIHVVNEGGTVVAQRDLEPQEGKADTSKWQPGDAYQGDANFNPSTSSPQSVTVSGVSSPGSGGSTPAPGTGKASIGAVKTSGSSAGVPRSSLPPGFASTRPGAP